MPEKNGDLIEVTRRGSERGLTDRQRATFLGLGLRKNQSTVLVEDTNATRGMVNLVSKWLDVKLIAKGEAAAARQRLQAGKAKKNQGYRVVAKGK